MNEPSKIEVVDVLIVTALKEEYDAVLMVDAGSAPNSTWVEGVCGIKNAAIRSFVSADGGLLRIVVTQARDMGRSEAANAAAPFLDRYKIRCLAMCGVCAGRRGVVELGDVIIADKVWAYDVGKLKVELDDNGQRVEHVQGDITTYEIKPDDWKQAAERVKLDGKESWLKSRPRSYENQSQWLLHCLLSGEDPHKHPDRAVRCVNFNKVLDLCLAKGSVRVAGSKIRLTESGHGEIQKLLVRYPDGLPEPAPFKIRMGAIGTGSRVIEDFQIFDKLSDSVRKVAGLEMEAAEIGYLAARRSIPHWIVTKGVMDFADSCKNDNFKSFAARASAECLLAFLRQQLPSKDSAHQSSILHIPKCPWLGSPGALLRPDIDTPVPFHGRTAELADLMSWCESERSLAVRLYTGEGGMGKTRLLIEACTSLKGKDWRMGFLGALDSRGSSSRHEQFQEAFDSDRASFVVVDYAETRRDDVVDLVQRLMKARDKARIVLLARHAGEWWEELKSADPIVGDVLGGPLYQRIRLTPLVMSTSDRQASFETAFRHFQSTLRQHGLPESLPDFSNKWFERVLILHMAALRAVEGIKSDRDAGQDGILDYVLLREQRFWNGLAKTVGISAEVERGIGVAMTAITLNGGAQNATEARRLIGQLPLFQGQTAATVAAVAELLHATYPGNEGLWVEPLQPDILGEHLVSKLDPGDENCEAIMRLTFKASAR